MNLFRDIPVGDKAPDIVNMVVEVGRGSRDKYEYRPEYEAFFLDRVLHSSVVFPVEYGFMPQTLDDDKDPLDMMVLSYEHLQVGCVLRVRPIGVLIMEDEAGDDAKILSVPIADPRYNEFNDLNDVPSHLLLEIQEFFETYKRLEPKKWVKIKCWKNCEEAKKVIKYTMNLYTKSIK
ncbi:MAG: inorganic pyrophosphatase [Thermoproteota archaeon]|nr:inorganic pyrophosphatase [Thermoproteota archaeon]